MSGTRIKLLVSSVSGDKWAKLLFALGWCLFWLAGTRGQRAPVPVLLIGPIIMFVAIVLLTRNRRKQQRAASGNRLSRATPTLVK